MVQGPLSLSGPGSLPDYLNEAGVVALEGVDTRALTHHIRTRGALRGAISTQDLAPESLVARVRQSPSMLGRNLVDEVGWQVRSAPPLAQRRFRVALVDAGRKEGIVRDLVAHGCDIWTAPYDADVEGIAALQPDGVLISNGPGDPAALTPAIRLIRGLLERRIPLAGICLGHQLLGLAIGGQTYKTRFGHRGANHPVRDYLTGRVEISSQNHGFAVEPPAAVRDALERGAVVGVGGVTELKADDMLLESEFGPAQVTHLNLNDGTVEGLRLLELPAYSVQYHPEAGPGPHDSQYLFRKFGDLMSKNAGTRARRPSGAG